MRIDLIFNVIIDVWLWVLVYRGVVGAGMPLHRLEASPTARKVSRLGSLSHVLTGVRKCAIFRTSGAHLLFWAIFRLYLDSSAILGTFWVCATPHTLASGTDIETPLEPAPRLDSWHNWECWHGACF